MKPNILICPEMPSPLAWLTTYSRSPKYRRRSSRTRHTSELFRFLSNQKKLQKRTNRRWWIFLRTCAFELDMTFQITNGPQFSAGLTGDSACARLTVFRITLVTCVKNHQKSSY